MGTACKNSQTACRTQDQKLLILHPVEYELPVPADAEQIVPRGFFQNGGGYPAEHINIRKNFFLFRRKGKPSGNLTVSAFFPPGYADTACRAAVLFQTPFILQRLFTQEYRAVRRGREFRKASRMNNIRLFPASIRTESPCSARSPLLLTVFSVNIVIFTAIPFP